MRSSKIEFNRKYLKHKSKERLHLKTPTVSMMDSSIKKNEQESKTKAVSYIVIDEF